MEWGWIRLGMINELAPKELRNEALLWVQRFSKEDNIDKVARSSLSFD